jgi:aspartyl-tRNA(Asn)/glutamyl-tRNA(Gln) amidotransferase subunit A
MTTVARSTTEICEMDARTLAAQVASKQLSPVEVIKAVLERMDKLEPVLHAFCTPTPDAALERARQLEAAIMSGEEVGPLAGVPFGMKDLIVTKGVRTASGSVIYKDFIPDEDDVVVERLLGAGGIMLGKTNVPEFGYSGVAHNPVFETTRNPWNPALTTGGSSRGSRAAVATGMGPIATGSDGGGSIRIPPPTVDFTGSRHRWAASPCTRAAAMSDTRASRAGNRWSTSVR